MQEWVRRVKMNEETLKKAQYSALSREMIMLQRISKKDQINYESQHLLAKEQALEVSRELGANDLSYLDLIRG